MNVLTNWKRTLMASSLAISLAPWAGAQAATAIDAISAVVNNDVIMTSELDAEVAATRSQLQRQQQPVPAEAILQQQVLEQLIQELLQIQEAENLGVEISATMLNNAMARIAQNNNLSLPQLHQAIVANGQTLASFRAQIERQMTIDEVAQIAVKKRIKVSEKEVDQFLASQQGQALADTEVLLGHILVSATSDADKRAAQATMAKAQAALEKGDDFAQVAMQFSDAGNAAEGGSLGWRKLSQLPALFADAVAPLGIGEVTQVLENSSGLHLIMVMDQRGLAMQEQHQTKAQHILVTTNDIRDKTATKELIDEIYQRLENGMEFYDLARGFSDDGNTALKGGDMGWLSANQLPEFMQQQLDALEAGQHSKPFPGPNGWHILKANERQTKNVGQAILRNKARTALHNSKFADELDNWLTELRNQAYIEIR